MATNERPPRTSNASAPVPDAAIGIDHPTVVPANFDPDDADDPRGRSERR